MREKEENVSEDLPLDEVRKLVELLKESGVEEIRVKKGEVEVAVKATTETPVHPPPAMPSRATSEAVHPPEVEPSPEMNGLHTVTSPLVGTFYRAPAPGEDYYVEVGDRVRAGQTLCIVEAMKLMNEIPADVSGEVVEVLAENSAGVEYGEPLFHIRPE